MVAALPALPGLVAMNDAGAGADPVTVERVYGVHAVWRLPEGTGVGVCCECRTQTELIIEASDEIIRYPVHIDLAEQSFTCDGCGTTHWFTLAEVIP